MERRAISQEIIGSYRERFGRNWYRTLSTDLQVFLARHHPHLRATRFMAQRHPYSAVNALLSPYLQQDHLIPERILVDFRDSTFRPELQRLRGGMNPTSGATIDISHAAGHSQPWSTVQVRAESSPDVTRYPVIPAAMVRESLGRIIDHYRNAVVTAYGRQGEKLFSLDSREASRLARELTKPRPDGSADRYAGVDLDREILLQAIEYGQQAEARVVVQIDPGARTDLVARQIAYLDLAEHIIMKSKNGEYTRDQHDMLLQGMRVVDRATEITKGLDNNKLLELVHQKVGNLRNMVELEDILGLPVNSDTPSPARAPDPITKQVAAPPVPSPPAVIPAPTKAAAIVPAPVAPPVKAPIIPTPTVASPPATPTIPIAPPAAVVPVSSAPIPPTTWIPPVSAPVSAPVIVPSPTPTVIPPVVTPPVVSVAPVSAAPIVSPSSSVIVPPAIVQVPVVMDCDRLAELIKIHDYKCEPLQTMAQVVSTFGVRAPVPPSIVEYLVQSYAYRILEISGQDRARLVSLAKYPKDYIPINAIVYEGPGGLWSINNPAGGIHIFTSEAMNEFVARIFPGAENRRLPYLPERAQLFRVKLQEVGNFQVKTLDALYNRLGMKPPTDPVSGPSDLDAAFRQSVETLVSDGVVVMVVTDSGVRIWGDGPKPRLRIVSRWQPLAGQYNYGVIGPWYNSANLSAACEIYRRLTAHIIGKEEKCPEWMKSAEMTKERVDSPESFRQLFDVPWLHPQTKIIDDLQYLVSRHSYQFLVYPKPDSSGVASGQPILMHPQDMKSGPSAIVYNLEEGVYAIDMTRPAEASVPSVRFVSPAALAKIAPITTDMPIKVEFPDYSEWWKKLSAYYGKGNIIAHTFYPGAANIPALKNPTVVRNFSTITYPADLSSKTTLVVQVSTRPGGVEKQIIAVDSHKKGEPSAAREFDTSRLLQAVEYSLDPGAADLMRMEFFEPVQSTEEFRRLFPVPWLCRPRLNEKTESDITEVIRHLATHHGYNFYLLTPSEFVLHQAGLPKDRDGKTIQIADNNVYVEEKADYPGTYEVAIRKPRDSASPKQVKTYSSSEITRLTANLGKPSRVIDTYVYTPLDTKSWWARFWQATTSAAIPDDGVRSIHYQEFSRTRFREFFNLAKDEKRMIDRILERFHVILITNFANLDFLEATTKTAEPTKPILTVVITETTGLVGSKTYGTLAYSRDKPTGLSPQVVRGIYQRWVVMRNLPREIPLWAAVIDGPVVTAAPSIVPVIKTPTTVSSPVAAPPVVAPPAAVSVPAFPAVEMNGPLAKIFGEELSRKMRIEKVLGYGNCFWEALAVAMYDDAWRWPEIKSKALTHLITHPELFDVVRDTLREPLEGAYYIRDAYEADPEKSRRVQEAIDAGRKPEALKLAFRDLYDVVLGYPAALETIQTICTDEHPVLCKVIRNGGGVMEFASEMGKSGTYVESPLVEAAMAAYPDQTIVIVQTEPRPDFAGVYNPKASGDVRIIAFNGRNHYDAVVPSAWGSSGEGFDRAEICQRIKEVGHLRGDQGGLCP